MGIKENKLAWLGMAALALTFGIALSGCGGIPEEGEGYVFRFKVDNNTSETLTKVEFINGDTRNDDPIRGAIVTNLARGKRSSEIRAQGFTVEYDENRRIFGVKVTYPDDTETGFAWSYAEDEKKILVSVSDSTISFSSGNW